MLPACAVTLVEWPLEHKSMHHYPSDRTAGRSFAPRRLVARPSV